MTRLRHSFAHQAFLPSARSIRGPGYGETLRYLFAHPVFKSPGLSIRGIGIRETMPPCLIERPVGTGDCLFMLFLDPVLLGPGPNWRPIEAGRMVFWNHGAAHYYGNPKTPWKHSWIHCDGSRVNEILRQVHVRCGEPVALANPVRTEKYLFDFHEEISGFTKPSAIILRNILENFVRDGVRSEKRSERSFVPAKFLECRERIDMHYSETLTLLDLARQVGLSVPHFCTEFRRHFGVPPIVYLNGRRMRVAAALLRGTGTRVGEIGRQVGYDDPYYFSKHFKAYFGVPPSVIRLSSSSAKG
ncbi:MAG TPA: AraC family transcriptional regulator [Candidatus Methylacidiphilales bacterium]